MPRLPAFLLLNCPPMLLSVTPSSGPVAAARASRPPTGAMAPMRVSGWALHSTLMLSAPSAARNRVPPADARNHVKSRMRIPSSGKGLPHRDRRPTGNGSRLATAGVRGAVGGEAVAQVAGHPVPLEEPHQALALLAAQCRHHEPAAVLGLGDARYQRRHLGGMATRLAAERSPAHHPVHEVELGVLGHRL